MAAYGSEELCGALPAWMAGEDKDEAARGVQKRIRVCRLARGGSKAVSAKKVEGHLAPEIKLGLPS